MKNLFDEMGSRRGRSRFSNFNDVIGDTHTGRWSSKDYTPTKRCHHDHPAMPLPNSDKVIYGGSCINPTHTDANVYVGLDGGMKATPLRFPWVDGHEVYYNIPDMQAPTNATEFKGLIAWIKGRLDAGDKVHVGCIGGHGRTGTVFSALVSLYGEKDAITYVRKHYCKKAVESAVQVSFLEKHFGVLPVDGYKSNRVYPKSEGISRLPTNTKDGPKWSEKEIKPLRESRSIWDQ